MVWYADDLIYDGVGMIAAYSGDTLIWKKGEAPSVLTGFKLVDRTGTLYKGHTYVLATYQVTSPKSFYAGLNRRTVGFDDASKFVMPRDVPSYYDETACVDKLPLPDDIFHLGGGISLELNKDSQSRFYYSQLIYSGTQGLATGDSTGDVVKFSHIPYIGSTTIWEPLRIFEAVYEYPQIS